MSRPYFETKVVKVKKEKEYSNQIIIDGKKYTLCKEESLHKEKGNWVNGENLDKIKFPCFCSFETGMRDYKRYGELDHIVCRDFSFYRIRELKQVGRANKEVSDCQYIKSFLKDIIETFDIHILKGKIILYEEEK